MSAVVMLAAEVADYLRLTREDEKGALEQLEAHRDQFLYPKIAEHSGLIVRATGDTLLVQFESPTEAVQCAVDLQRGMIDRNIHTLPDRRTTFRVGVSIGRVTGDGADLVSRAVAALSKDTLATLIKPSVEIFGERGDIAARLAALAEPGGVCISGDVQDAIHSQLPYMFEDIGEHNLEIRAAPVHCYVMKADSVAPGPRPAVQNPQGRRMSLQNAALAVSGVAAVGVWGVALWAWLATHSSTAPTPAPPTVGSHAPSVGVAADGAALARPLPQSPPISSTAAETATQASPASENSLASNAAVDGGFQAPSSRPALSEIGAVVVRGKQAPSELQTTPDDSANSGAAVVRGKLEASAQPVIPDSGTAVVRGNQAPSTLQTAPNAGTDVVRGARVASGPPLSSHPDQR
jgi:class 3 adenylate cyclase